MYKLHTFSTPPASGVSPTEELVGNDLYCSILSLVAADDSENQNAQYSSGNTYMVKFQSSKINTIGLYSAFEATIIISAGDH